MSIVTLNRQEAFNRAWEGLRSQGFTKSTFVRDNVGCSYDGPGGKKCAWGWVDPEGTKNTIATAYSKDYDVKPGDTVQCNGNVSHISRLGDPVVSLATYLGDDDLKFARNLQQAHDDSHNPTDMKYRLVLVALRSGLTIPDPALQTLVDSLARALCDFGVDKGARNGIIASVVSEVKTDAEAPDAEAPRPAPAIGSAA